MTLNFDDILARLSCLQEGDDRPSRYLVAFSGGVDSTVLLHALAATRDRHGLDVVAIHVDHGLHSDSGLWEERCRRVAADLNVQYVAHKVTVAKDEGYGIEAAAREARYGVMHGMVQSGDWLLSAHHEDDQAETLLLNLFRGSSLAGLAGIGRNRAFGAGRLVRPLLGVGVDEIVACAKENKLEWIDDPSNEDERFDRNFLRQTILPELAERWPSVSARISQSAELASEASDLLNDLAQLDIASLCAESGNCNKLHTVAMSKLSGARQRNAIRYAIRECGLPPAPATRLYQAVHELIPARVDAQPLVQWRGGELRRYQDYLYILTPEIWLGQESARTVLPGVEGVDLGPGQGRLSLVAGTGGGISAELVESGLRLGYREGGEEIRPDGHDCTRKLKKLLQDESVVPWMRGRIPLLYAGERLIAVANLWVAADAVTDPGHEVRWEGGPALF